MLGLYNKIKENYFLLIVLAMALIVGFLYVSPQLLIRRNIENDKIVYLPLQVVGEHCDEAMSYVPMSKEINDGFGPPRDLFIDKYKDSPSVLPQLPSYLYSSLFIFSQDVNSVYLIGNFVFPAILFVMFYMLGRLVVKDKVFSLFFASLATLSPLVMSMPESVISFDRFINNFIKYFIPIIKTPLPNLALHEMHDPLLTYLIYIPAIASLFHFINKPTKGRALAAGIFIGLLFYSYLFYWVYLIAAVGLFFIFNLFKKDKKKLKMILLLIGIIVLISMPYWVNQYNFSQLSHADDIKGRIGLEHGRQFRTMVWPQYFVYAIFFLFNYLVFKKKDYNKYIFYCIGLLAMFICWNLQIILGFMPHPDHWFRAFSPILFIFVFDFTYQLIKYLAKQNKKIVFILPLIAIILTSLLYFKKIVNAYSFVDIKQKFIEQYSFDREIYQSYSWLEQNLPAGSKIISPSYVTSFYLSLYTSSDAYLPPATNSLASNMELERRFLEVMKLFNLESGKIKQLLTDQKCQSQSSHSCRNLHDVPLNIYYNYYTDQSFNFSFLSSSRDIPENKIKELLRRYGALKIKWPDFKGKYIYYGPFEQEIAGNFNFDNNLFKLIFSNNKVKIYLVK